MKQKLLLTPAMLAISVWLVLSFERARAACGDVGGGVDAGLNCGSAAGPSSLVSSIRIITNTILFAAGVIAVVMLIIGGIKYATSAGDPKTTKSAQDTILYSVVGIVVALLGYAIVNFVLGQFR